MTVFVILGPGAEEDQVQSAAEKCNFQCKSFMEYTESEEKIVYFIDYKDVEQLNCYQSPKILITGTDDAILSYFKQFENETQAEIELQNFEEADLASKVDISLEMDEIQEFEQFLMATEQNADENEADLMEEVQNELAEKVEADEPQVQQQESQPEDLENEDLGPEDDLSHVESEPDVEEQQHVSDHEEDQTQHSIDADKLPYDVLLVQLQRANEQLNSYTSEDLGISEMLLRENQDLRRVNEQLLRRLGELQTKGAVVDPVAIEHGIRAISGMSGQSPVAASASPSGHLTHGISTSVFRSQLSDLQQETQIVKREILRPRRTSYSYANVPNPVPLELVCKICLEPFEHPVRLPCGHAFCCTCLLLNESHSGTRCPQCQKTFEAFPGVDYELEGRVQAQCGFDESIKKGDLVRLIDGDVGRVVEITRNHYDFELRQLSADVRLPLLEIARVQTPIGMMRSEVFNLTRLSPEYCRVSTRFTANAFLVKSKPPQRLEYGADEYSPFAQKFAFLPSLSFCTSQSQILELDGFETGAFRLRDAQGNVFTTESLDEYLALETDIPELLSDSEHMCVGCFSAANLLVRSVCGHIYCLSCAVKLLRNQLPCVFCGESLSLSEKSNAVLYEPEIAPESCFIDNGLLVFCEQKMEFVVQILTRGADKMVVLEDLNNNKQIYKWQQIQAIPFDQLVPALRPIAGDIVVQLGKQYKSLAYADGQTIIGAYRRAAMFKAAYLVQNIRLIQRTDLTERMCVECREVMRRPVSAPCGHRCCRTCAIISCVGGIGCFACGAPVPFADCAQENAREVDVGTIAMKRHSRTNSYGSLYGFVRAIDLKRRQVEVTFASASQKMGENDIIYLTEENLVVKGQPVMNQLCVVNSGDLKGVYGIAVNSMTKEVMLEIGVKVVCRDCSMVQVAAKPKAQ